MKILIASDTHGKNDRLEKLERAWPDALLYLHAGDWGEDPSKYDHWITVSGNNDLRYASKLESNRVVLAGNHRILLIHSHQYPSASRNKKLARRAREEGCDIVVCGHSHVAAVENIDGVLIINPGSLYRSRDGRGPSYAVLTIEPDLVRAEILYWSNLDRDTGRSSD